ncbi:hypothetical protein ACYAFX_19920 [Rhodococcus aetherivorans]
MVRRGPLITLAAVVVLAAVLLAVNVSKEDGGPTPAPGPAATSAPAPTTTAAPSTAVAFPAQATYVAQIPVATGTLTLAIAVEGEDAVAYACDGSAVESWLSGDAEDGRLELEGRDGARLDGEFDGTTVRGTLWLGDRSWTFDAAPAEPRPASTSRTWATSGPAGSSRRTGRSPVCAAPATAAPRPPRPWRRTGRRSSTGWS